MLMMLEGLDEAGGWCGGLEEGGRNCSLITAFGSVSKGQKQVCY